MDKLGEEGRDVILFFLWPLIFFSLCPCGVVIDFSQLILLKRLRCSAWLHATAAFKCVFYFYLMLLGSFWDFSSCGKH